MTEEERQDEINKEFYKYFPTGTSFEKAYRKLKRYNGKYKNDFTNILANMIIDEYCAGYYRYGKKQTDIKNPQKELYLTICDDLLPDQCDLDEAIYCFIKGINRKVIPCIEKVFKNFEANNKSTDNHDSQHVTFTRNILVMFFPVFGTGNVLIDLI